MLPHLFIPGTDGHIDASKKIHGTPIPYPYGHGFDLPDLGLFWQSAGHDRNRGARAQNRSVNLITYFDGDPEKQILILADALLSLLQELHIHPGSLQTVVVRG